MGIHIAIITTHVRQEAFTDSSATAVIGSRGMQLCFGIYLNRRRAEKLGFHALLVGRSHGMSGLLVTTGEPRSAHLMRQLSCFTIFGPTEKWTNGVGIVDALCSGESSGPRTVGCATLP